MKSPLNYFMETAFSFIWRSFSVVSFGLAIIHFAQQNYQAAIACLLFSAVTMLWDISYILKEKQTVKVNVKINDQEI